jgi:polar amino acid transport system substrate-binding protein
MVRDVGDANRPANPFVDLVELLVSPMILVWLAFGAILILVPAHMIWLFDRKKEEGITRGKDYIPGIFYAMMWCATALVSQVQELPNHWLARVLGLVWMFAGVVFVAFYTAQLTTTLTVQKIQGSINGPDDLPGKQVATIASSTAADYLRSRNAQVQSFEQPERMFRALIDKKVEAVVFSAPVLLYYTSHEGKGRARMVGAEFNTAPIAYAVQLNSPLRRKINFALLKLREDGTYQQIYTKWFGGNDE